MRFYARLVVFALIFGPGVTQAADKPKSRAKARQASVRTQAEVQGWISPQWNEAVRPFAAPSGFTGQIQYSTDHRGGEFLLVSPWMPGKRGILRGTDQADWNLRQESATAFIAEGIPFHIEGFQFPGPKEKGPMAAEYLLTTTRLYKIKWISPGRPDLRELAWPLETSADNSRQIIGGYQVQLPDDKRPGGADPAFAYVLADATGKHFEGILFHEVFRDTKRDIVTPQYAEILYGKAHGLPAMEYSNKGDVLRLRIQVAETKLVSNKAKTVYVDRILPIDLRTKKVLTLEDPKPKKVVAKVAHK